MATLQSIKQRYGIIGRSELLDRALATASRVANTDLTVLITGESGSGKEVFSKVIHNLSTRKHNKIIAVNCGAIPQGTINSELFGHEKGAFTGASSERKGYFETVNGGTIFLDEVGEMPLDTQAYLLRILETGEYMRVGSSKTSTTDVRVIAATNVPLDTRIKSGKFREDLYYRLNTVPIQVPSLRQRPEDILLLFRKFVTDFGEKYRSQNLQLDDKAKLILENYSWPGNIRELKNLAEQLSVLNEEKLITGEALLEFAPYLLKRNLPVPSGRGTDKFDEREILYKLLFDMKGDLNDLKSLVFELIKKNDLEVPSSGDLLPLLKSSSTTERNRFGGIHSEDHDILARSSNIQPNDNEDEMIILNSGENYRPSEVVEESLSLEDMEKDMIQKALKKHKGKRKRAAGDLGISERTLYRKINQYNIQ